MSNLKTIVSRARAALGMHPLEALGRALRNTGHAPVMAAKLTVLGGLRQRPADQLVQLMCEFEQRYEETTGFRPPRYAGRRIVEVGCGVRGGVGVLAAVRGAQSYLGVDPGVVPQIFKTPSIRRRFLSPAAATAAAFEQSALERESLLRHFDDVCSFFAGPIEALPESDAPFDLAVSISALEHIGDLGEAMKVLRKRTTPDGRHFHVVNFSNHLSKAKPFAEIYEMPPEAFRAVRGRQINLMRPEDVARAFAEAGFKVEFMPLDVRTDALEGLDIDPWWRERYSVEQLAIRTGIFATTG